MRKIIATTCRPQFTSEGEFIICKTSFDSLHDEKGENIPDRLHTLIPLMLDTKNEVLFHLRTEWSNNKTEIIIQGFVTTCEERGMSIIGKYRPSKS